MKRLVVVALAACTPKPAPTLVPEIAPGPAASVRPNRVLVLASTCGSLEVHCPSEYIQTVDTIVRGGFEFAGYAVVDSDTLRKDTRERHEEHDDTETQTSSRTHTDVDQDLNPFDTHIDSTGQSDTRTRHDHVVLDGPGFEDLSIDERHEIMGKSGADAVASIRIVIGGQTGVWAPNQNVEVQVKLGVNSGDTMAWAARCTASSNDFSTVTAALENAARCAINGATHR